MPIIGTIAGVAITENSDSSLTYTSEATVDGDGANGQFGGLPCYAPATYPGRTLDVLSNAGHPGNWWGVVTDKNGNPIQQISTDPAPGAYVSSTTLCLFGPKGEALPDSSPFKSVDAATVPFISVPSFVVGAVAGIVVGCKCVVTYNGTSVTGVVADTGSNKHIGEISVAMAQALGIPVGSTHPANGGGVAQKIVNYQLWPGVVAVVNGVTYPLQPS